jgi:hypothetical protein
MISRCSGNRRAVCFEKTVVPSTMTSNAPRSPGTIDGSSASSLAMAAARLAACGR